MSGTLLREVGGGNLAGKGISKISGSRKACTSTLCLWFLGSAPIGSALSHTFAAVFSANSILAIKILVETWLPLYRLILLGRMVPVTARIISPCAQNAPNAPIRP